MNHEDIKIDIADIKIGQSQHNIQYLVPRASQFPRIIIDFVASAEIHDILFEKFIKIYTNYDFTHEIKFQRIMVIDDAWYFYKFEHQLFIVPDSKNVSTWTLPSYFFNDKIEKYCSDVIDNMLVMNVVVNLAAIDRAHADIFQWYKEQMTMLDLIFRDVIAINLSSNITKLIIYSNFIDVWYNPHSNLRPQRDGLCSIKIFNTNTTYICMRCALRNILKTHIKFDDVSHIVYDLLDSLIENTAHQNMFHRDSFDIMLKRLASVSNESTIEYMQNENAFYLSLKKDLSAADKMMYYKLFYGPNPELLQMIIELFDAFDTSELIEKFAILQSRNAYGIENISYVGACVIYATMLALIITDAICVDHDNHGGHFNTTILLLICLVLLISRYISHTTKIFNMFDESDAYTAASIHMFATNRLSHNKKLIVPNTTLLNLKAYTHYITSIFTCSTNRDCRILCCVKLIPARHYHNILQKTNTCACFLLIFLVILSIMIPITLLLILV
jgi:hypothetical protein